MPFEKPTPGDTSVYVHFPWCARKCPYCDFATRAIEPRAVPGTRYADAVLRELEARAASLSGRRLVSIFFGGGTPSLWDPAELGRVLAAIRGAFARRADELEVTAECNPSSLDREGAAALVEAGVNRLSIGVQSLDDRRLRFLGRLHDADGARRVLAAARAEVPRLSADLMFGTPGQDRDALRRELDEVVGLGVEHVSAYALTIEPGTLFGELQRRGKLKIASEDEYAAMFGEAEEALRVHGLHHYEVSNYARPGAEARHNQHYWRGGAYLGLGAAAVGCLDEEGGRARRWRNVPDPARYLAHSAPPVVEAEEEHLTPGDRIREALMLGLRTREGTDLAALARRVGSDPLEGRQAAIARRQQAGDLIVEGHHLRVPPERWLMLDGIVAELF